MSKSKIEWTERTWEPVLGCSRASPGCEHCYAERLTWRLAHNPACSRSYKGLVTWNGGIHWTGEVRCDASALEQPLRWRKPSRIFVCSRADLFHEKVPDEYIAAVFGVMAACPQHTFIVLTKRAARMRRWFDWVARDPSSLSLGEDPTEMTREWCRAESTPQRRCIHAACEATGFGVGGGPRYPWPLPNVWVGCTAEDQQRADERVPELLATPAAVRWVSVEPMLQAVNLSYITVHDPPPNEPDEHNVVGGYFVDALTGMAWDDLNGRLPEARGPHLDWVVVGGESGPGARPCDVDWIRAVVTDCACARVPLFVKQLGAVPYEDDVLLRGGDLEVDLVKHRKGADPSEWPEDLRVREYPQEAPRRG